MVHGTSSNMILKGWWLPTGSGVPAALPPCLHTPAALACSRRAWSQLPRGGACTCTESEPLWQVMAALVQRARHLRGSRRRQQRRRVELSSALVVGGNALLQVTSCTSQLLYVLLTGATHIYMAYLHGMARQAQQEPQLSALTKY
jgi:hypothetical protein